MSLVQIQGLNAEKQHAAGCLICGQELLYEEQAQEQNCIYCGHLYTSSMHCPNGHFVCDECHSADATRMIELITAQSQSQNPVALAMEIMDSPPFHMHGPEHHVMVPAILLTTLRNLDVPITDNQMRDALHRAKQLPGGICGSWGACGTAIGAGIGLSILRHLTSVKKEGWGETNNEVGEILQRVAAYGGPRCCKRSTYSSLLATMEILERDGIVRFPTEAHAIPVCKHFWQNQQCIKEQCPYYPRPKQSNDGEE